MSDMSLEAFVAHLPKTHKVRLELLLLKTEIDRLTTTLSEVQEREKFIDDGIWKERLSVGMLVEFGRLDANWQMLVKENAKLKRRVKELEEDRDSHARVLQDEIAKTASLEARVKELEEGLIKEGREKELHFYKLGKDYGRCEQVDMAAFLALEAENQRLREALRKIYDEDYDDHYGPTAYDLASQALKEGG